MRRKNSSSGSRPVKFLTHEEVNEALLVIEGLVKDQKIPCCVVGGLAMARLGSPRLTADVDVAALQIPDGLPQGRPLSFGGVAVKIGRVPVDVIVRSDDFSPLYEEAVLAARSGAVRPEHLAAMKMAAGRPKDESDLLFLISSGRLDLAKARAVVKRHFGAYGLASFKGYVAQAELQERLDES